MTPIVLVHGGGLDSRCWDPLLTHLPGPVLAVDLPGRGAHPAPLGSVTFATCAASVRDDVDAAGFDEIVLVGTRLPEALNLNNDPVDLSPLSADMPRTWVRTLQDIIIAAPKQLH